MTSLGLRKKLRYRFDNLMARGVGAQILMLAGAVLVVVVVFATIIHVASMSPAGEGGSRDTYPQLLWRTLMHQFNTGKISDDDGGTGYLSMLLLTTLGGIFVLSSLIGVLSNSLGDALQNLRRGKSLVAEEGHTVILGYTPKIHTLLSELAEANANQAHACVVIMADKDKIEMDEDIRKRVPSSRMSVVTRSGNPLSLPDLEIVNLPSAKAVIVTSPEHDEKGEPLAPHESDTVVLKTLLAVTKQRAQSTKGGLHVVAELQDKKILDVARMVAGEDAALLLAPPLISRLMVQTGRQSGLSIVFTELLNFGGSEIYTQLEPGLTGKTFREGIIAYDDSVLLGVITKDEKLLLPPAFERPFEEGDRVIAISEDDDTVILNGRPSPIDEKDILPGAAIIPKGKERSLVLGTSERLVLVIRELVAYVAAGSEIEIVGEDERADKRVAELRQEFPQMTITFQVGDITDRRVLDGLAVESFDHILVLSESAGRSTEIADARTMVTLLHLRDLMRKSGKTVPVTSEVLDIQSRELATVAEADDFIVSNTLVALLMAQLSENRHLWRVFDEIFTPGGHEIYLKPARDYVTLGKEMEFYTVVESVARRADIALGYRVGKKARDSKADYGVVVNPKKSDRVAFEDGDQIIVLAD